VPLLAAAAGTTAFVASRALAAFPDFTESVYANGLGPILARPLSLATGLLPFALVELLLIGYIVWTLALLVFALRSVFARRRSLGDVASGGVRRVLRDGGIIVFLLYLLFGFNYARAPLETRLGWGEWQGVAEEEVVALAEAAVAMANQRYLELHGSEDAREPTRLPENLRSLEDAIDDGWSRGAEALALPERVGAHYGPVKRPLISPLLARMSLYGVYSPFTAEANVVRGVPAVRTPHSMCHEKAHQRGIAVEAEASFVGFIACGLSSDPLARYSAASFAQGQLVGALPARERLRVAAQRLPGVQRDLVDLDAYLARNRTRASAVQNAVNDRYLRANRVPGGVRSYALSVRLLILYAQRNDGALLPAS
jgi:hypothetical protein